MRSLATCCLSSLLLLTACGGSAQVSLYVALDQEHSEAIVRRFEQQTGLSVKTRFDTEASKTVGLVSAIVEEAARPRCDVFWNNELAQTVRLAQNGLLQAYVSPSAAAIPSQWKDPQGLWAGGVSGDVLDGDAGCRAGFGNSGDRRGQARVR